MVYDERMERWPDRQSERQKSHKEVGAPPKKDKKVNVTDTDKDKINNPLFKIIFDLNERNKYRHIDYDDQNYYGIKDIEHLYTNPDDYYKPILAKQSFDHNYEFYACTGNKNKESSLKQYIDKVLPYLGDLINKKKDNQKIQLDVGINMGYNINSKKKYTIYIKSKNIESFPGNDVNDIITELTDSLFENYEERLQILNNGSDFVYESVESLGIHFHTIEIKRGYS